MNEQAKTNIYHKRILIYLIKNKYAKNISKIAGSDYKHHKSRWDKAMCDLIAPSLKESNKYPIKKTSKGYELIKRGIFRLLNSDGLVSLIDENSIYNNNDMATLLSNALKNTEKLSDSRMGDILNIQNEKGMTLGNAIKHAIDVLCLKKNTKRVGKRIIESQIEKDITQS